MEPHDNILKQFKDAADKAASAPSFPGKDKLWERVERRLDEQKKERVIPFRKIALAAALLLLVCSGTVYFLLRKDKIIPAGDQGMAVKPAALPAPVPVAQDTIRQQVIIQQVIVQQVALPTDAGKELPDTRFTNVKKQQGESIAVAEESYTGPEVAAVPPAERQLVEADAYSEKELQYNHSASAAPLVYAEVAEKKRESIFQKLGKAFVSVLPKKKANVENIARHEPLRIVSGTVTDEQGVGIAGAVVNLKGTDLAARTDKKGNYVLSLPPAADTLLVAANGDKPVAVAIGGQTDVPVTLHSGSATIPVQPLTVQLSSAPYTYQTSAAFNTIDAAASPYVSLYKGSTTGYTVPNGKTAKKTAKRPAAKEADAPAPLIIVDGQVFKGKLSDIDPDDIQTVTILKDADAASRYGSMGTNGVLVFGGGKDGIDTQVVIRTPAVRAAENAPLIVVDGKIYEGKLSDLDAENIQSMAIVKGAEAVALYGSKDGNGVLAITMKKKEKPAHKARKPERLK